MSHNVETMAYTNEVPWHGLGVHIAQAPSVKEMLKTAKLNWRVDRVPLFTKDGDEVPGFAALQRSSDKSVLDVVGSRYQPVQNEDAFEFFNEFVQAGKATMETAGSLQGGRYVWGLANLKQSFELKGGDKVKGYLLCACPHQQGKSMLYKFTSVRVVCNNTYTLALNKGGAQWRMSHARKFNEEAITEAKDALGIARDEMSEFEKTAKKLQSIKLKREKVIELLGLTFQPGEELKDMLAEGGLNKKMEMIMQAYEMAPGAEPGNAWGALNAVTYWADHQASRTADKRLTNAWLGKTAVQKERVLADLLEAA